MRQLFQFTNWYCAQTYPHCEFLSAKELRRQRFEVLLPTIDVDRIRCGIKVGSRTLPLFSGYVFIRFHNLFDNWRPITNTYGIKRLFSSGPESPTPIPQSSIDTLLQSLQVVEEQPEIEKVVVVHIEKNDECRVLAGTFVNEVGICEWSSRTRAALWLNIMLGRVKVTFDVNDLQRVVPCP